jgi:hypothetical protein
VAELTVVSLSLTFALFLLLWHKRTVKRDAMQERITLDAMMRLAECNEDRAKAIAYNAVQELLSWLDRHGKTPPD